MKAVKIILAITGVLVLAGLATGCYSASASSDETTCVYDGDSSKKLKFQLFPGDNKRDTEGDDEVVKIPTSFRFYAAFEDRAIADAGAPSSYLGYAKGNTPVNVQGSFKFRFLTENACEWYARHGRRNAGEDGLGFNARSSESASDFSPWVRWLNENFGTVAKQSIKSASTGFTWPELTYGNDPDAPARAEPVDVAYGKVIGREFTRRLNASLGGKFFCGTDPSIWDDPALDESCPPIFFEVGPTKPQNEALAKEREATEKLRAELENATTQAQIRKQKAAATLEDQTLQQQLLRQEAETARLTALKNAELQKCLILAKAGLDCEGKFPQRIVVGAGN